MRMSEGLRSGKDDPPKSPSLTAHPRQRMDEDLEISRSQSFDWDRRRAPARRARWAAIDLDEAATTIFFRPKHWMNSVPPAGPGVAPGAAIVVRAF
ncbi:hypothetical protein Ddye_016912 [Dipteronia dyeriana]|uniref:Uncharacterized protein n=1 Tax=Dipteronia dyeriana TaxID=168575 RepID=A0AAD9U8A0_9ROSI|nr:hypothetical protein Ddye_016912 [Dipteronia dyeriana]